MVCNFVTVVPDDTAGNCVIAHKCMGPGVKNPNKAALRIVKGCL